MHKFKSLDRKYLVVVIALFLGAVFIYFFKQSVLNFIRFIIEQKITFVSLGIYSFVINLVHKIKFNDIAIKADSQFSEFKEQMENIIAVIFSPSLFICILSLAKGLYLQFFFNSEYFKNYSDFEISLLTVIVAYVLYSSLVSLLKLTREAMTTPIVEKPVPQESASEQRKQSNN